MVILAFHCKINLKRVGRLYDIPANMPQDFENVITLPAVVKQGNLIFA